MPEEPRKSPSVQPAGESKTQRVPITIGSARDVPVQWANKVIVNFIGTEFLVSMLAAAPEPFAAPVKDAPRKLEAKVLARYAISVPAWAAAVASFTKQIEGLQAEGAFSLELIEEAKQ